MNDERLSRAWAYPAICQPAFRRSSMRGFSSVAHQTVAEKPGVTTSAATARQKANQRAFHRDTTVGPFAAHCFGSISILWAQEHKKGADDDPQIEPNAPVFYVPEIVGNPLLHQLQLGGLATETLDLCPTG